MTNNDANSLFNSFQLGVTRRFTKGFSYALAYTLSRLEDDGSAQRDIIPNAYDAGNLWGPATYDRRHVFVVNAIYEFPFFKNQGSLSGKMLGGWAISAVSQFQTGRLDDRNRRRFCRSRAGKRLPVLDHQRRSDASEQRKAVLRICERREFLVPENQARRELHRHRHLGVRVYPAGARNFFQSVRSRKRLRTGDPESQSRNLQRVPRD